MNRRFGLHFFLFTDFLFQLLVLSTEVVGSLVGIVQLALVDSGIFDDIPVEVFLADTVRHAYQRTVHAFRSFVAEFTVKLVLEERGSQFYIDSQAVCYAEAVDDTGVPGQFVILRLAG